MQQRFSSLIDLFGFTLLRNGVKYDYSFKESLLSLLPIVKETYLALDPGTDSTQEEVSKIPGVKIVPSVWDLDLKKGLVLSVETNKSLEALRAVHGDKDNAWGIYLQADEVIHEDDYEVLLKDLEEAQKSGCDALSFRYLHFWQTHHHVAISKKWYPKEIRAIKLKTNIESWGDAQGFRNYKKVYNTEARIFHYGHVREQNSYKNKMRDMGSLYHESQDLEKRLAKGLKDAKKNKCVLYFGSHPKVMKDRILRMNDIWELEEKSEIYIVGKPEKYSSTLIKSIKAKKINWVNELGQVPGPFKKDAVITEPGLMDKLLKRSTVPLKMKSKLASNWGTDFLLVLQLSEKRIGLRV